MNDRPARVARAHTVSVWKFKSYAPRESDHGPGHGRILGRIGLFFFLFLFWYWRLGPSHLADFGCDGYGRVEDTVPYTTYDCNMKSPILMRW